MDSSLLAPFPVRSAASLSGRFVANDDSCLQSDDSAFCALTDFQRELIPSRCRPPLLSMTPKSEMNRFGVHALLVTQDEAGVLDSQIVGLICRLRHRAASSASKPQFARSEAR